MKKTNYNDIEGKSVWDLYVENFRDHIWDGVTLTGGISFSSSIEEEAEELAAEKVKREKKAKKDLARPPFIKKKKLDDRPNKQK
jgi:hypothetical protein